MSLFIKDKKGGKEVIISPEDQPKSWWVNGGRLAGQGKIDLSTFGQDVELAKKLETVA